MDDRLVSLLCYMNGSIIEGNNGIEYDKPASRVLNVRSSIGFDSFIEYVCQNLDLDRSLPGLEFVYRYGSRTPSGNVWFMPLFIRSENDLTFMMNCSPSPQHLIELFITKPSVGSQMSGSSRNVVSESEEVEDNDDDDDVGREDIDDSVTGVCEPFGRFRSIPASNDENVEIDMFTDEEEIDEGDGRLHEVPSTSMSELDMDYINSMTATGLLNVEGGMSGELKKGKTFVSKQDVKNVVKRHAILGHHHFDVVQSNKKLWVVQCKKYRDGCEWRLRAIPRKSHGKWEITQYYGVHTCIYQSYSQDHEQIDSKFIANEVKQLVKNDPSIKIVSLQEILNKLFEYNVNYWKVWDGKRKAEEMLYGNFEDSYRLLPKWMNILKMTNSGTVVKWRLGRMEERGDRMFEMVFWSFGAVIEGFKHCRPIIQIDGTFLTGKYKGKLLVATAIDSNGHIFPLAFAIVEEESADSWGWFLRHLRHSVTDREGICLISDRHKGIIAAVNDADNGWTEPTAHHRFCLRHISSNFNHKYKNKQLKSMVYAAGAQHQVRKFEACMNEIKDINPNCLRFFDSLQLRQWTLSHDGGHRYGWCTTNVAECINGVLRGGRRLPITGLVQLTFYRTVKYFEDRRKEIRAAVRSGDDYTRLALDKIVEWDARADRHHVTSFNKAEGVFEVVTTVRKTTGRGGNTHVVKLSEGTCTCNKWQGFGIPCSHVIAACKHCRIDYMQFVESCYLLESYQESYAPNFEPIPHEDYWPEPDFPILHPDPTLVRPPGRPRTSRIRNEMDERTAVVKGRCGICHRDGHNRRTCPDAVKAIRP